MRPARLWRASRQLCRARARRTWRFGTEPKHERHDRRLSSALADAQRRARLLRLRQPDRLDVHEFVDAEAVEFATVTGVTDAAEGQARIRVRHPIDEDTLC